jgi:hypothetical protein
MVAIAHRSHTVPFPHHRAADRAKKPPFKKRVNPSPKDQEKKLA